MSCVYSISSPAAGTGADVDNTGAAAEAEAEGSTVDYSSTDDRTVFVSNLSYQTTELQLTDKFSPVCSAYYNIDIIAPVTLILCVVHTCSDVTDVTDLW